MPSTGFLQLFGLLKHVIDIALHIERLLGDIVVLAFHHFLETADGVRQLHVLAFNAGELLGDVERLRKEALDFAGARYGQLVFVGEFVDTQNRDDVLEVFVALQDLLDRLRRVVVFVSENARIQNARRGRQRIDRRVDTQFRNGTRQVGGRVQVSECGRRGRIGVVVGWHVNRLNRRNRAFLRRRDALLQFAHFRRQVGLITHRRWHAPKQRRYFRARLREPEDVVDKEQHVLPFLIAEILGDGQAAQAHAEARAGRLGHLAVHQRDLRFRVIVRIEHARFLHFEPQVVAFARTLADTGEHGDAAVLQRDVVDQLHDDDGLADARAAEQADLAAAQIRLQQVDDLDAALEHLQLGRLLFEIGRRAMNGPALFRVDRTHVVDRLADYVQHAAQRLFADRYRNRPAQVDRFHAAHHAF